MGWAVCALKASLEWLNVHTGISSLKCCCSSSSSIYNGVVLNIQRLHFRSLNRSTVSLFHAMWLHSVTHFNHNKKWCVEDNAPQTHDSGSGEKSQNGEIKYNLTAPVYSKKTVCYVGIEQSFNIFLRWLFCLKGSWETLQHVIVWTSSLRSGLKAQQRQKERGRETYHTWCNCLRDHP